MNDQASHWAAICICFILSLLLISTGTNAQRASRSRDRCQPCTVNEREYAGHSRFQYEENCNRYHCICRCNGTYDCPDSHTHNVCEESTSSSSSSSTRTRGYRGRCVNCVVDGNTYKGHSYFSHDRGCTRWENCICRCNGSWICPPERAKSICNDQNNNNSNVDRRRGTRCQNCIVGGIERKGNSYFELVKTCKKFRHCICRCDGTWSCPERFSQNTCPNKPTTQAPKVTQSVGENCRPCQYLGSAYPNNKVLNLDSENCQLYGECTCSCNGTWMCTSDAQEKCWMAKTVCNSCHAKGRSYPGNSFFQLRDGCKEYPNCRCNCDGSWNCPNVANNICTPGSSDNDKSNPQVNVCKNCRANGKIVKGGSMFDLISGCISYKDCECKCNGSWECSGDKAKDICLNNTRSSHGCLKCKSYDGNLHPANAPFSFRRDCIEYNCDCHCNGSWSCPSERSRWGCTDRCHGCDVTGRKIASNTTFTHKTGCLEYTCDCHCNGSWSCPGRTVRNTCPVGVNINCNKCIVSPTKKYEGETDFVLKQGCLHYKCRCNCDGSYSCPGNDARNICRGERLGGCRSCVVSESEVFRGETDFSFRKGCISYQCRCNCDGSWTCPAKDTRDVCLGEVPGGCRVCRVDGKSHQAHTIFDLKKGCIHYKCKCNCDGGWSCPGEDARDVCKGEVPGGCRSCQISENEFYPGQSNFEIVKNCIHYKCRCHCNGGYNCPGSRAKRVCEAKDENAPLQCKTCVVSDTEKFQGNSSFSVDRGCDRYMCQCKCDGSWECPASTTENICKAADRPTIDLITKQRHCKPCKIGRDVIPGNSRFKFTRHCIQFNCRCNCTGAWSCDHKKKTDVCKLRRQLLKRLTIVAQANITVRDDLSSENTNNNSSSSSKEKNVVKTGEVSNPTVNTRDVDKNVTIGHNTTAQSQIAGSNIKDIYSDSFPLTAPPVLKIDHTANMTDPGNDNEQNNTSSILDASDSTDLLYNDTRVTNDSDAAFNPNLQCNKCHIGTFARELNDVFDYRTDCIHYSRCVCLCSGNWRCGEEKDRCKDASVKHTRGNSSENGGNSRTQEVTSSTIIDLNGTDTNHVIKGEDGHEISIDVDYSPTGKVRGSKNGNVRDLGSVTDLYKKNGVQAGGCNICNVETQRYRAGSNFNLRRGCVLYKCTCMCSGSYRCEVTTDHHCTDRDRQRSCGNCVYQSLVFPGNMGFTVRERCVERLCKCFCNGTHICPSSSYVQGCNEGSASRSSPGSFYPLNAQRVATNTGYIFRSSVDRTTFIQNGNIAMRQNSCKGCKVEGQERHGNRSFTFMKNCVEFNCFCECGGSWKCSSRRSNDCIDKTVIKPDRQNPRCKHCIVQGRTHRTESKFPIRRGCYEFLCNCDCDGTWDCPQQQPSYVCPTKKPKWNQDNDARRTRIFQSVTNKPIQTEEKQFGRDDSGTEQRTCRECRLDGQVFIPNKEFQYLRDKCYLYNCYCHCNGSFSCPVDRIHNVCNTQRNHINPKRGTVHVGNPKVTVDESGEPVRIGDIPGCQKCFMHGRHVEPLGMFIRKQGCLEMLCHCECNGETSCPESASVNVCELEDKKPMGERPGCKVGRRTHFTRVFGLVENCIQRICICHDDGTWTCRHSPNDKKVC